MILRRGPTHRYEDDVAAPCAGAVDEGAVRVRVVAPWREALAHCREAALAHAGKRILLECDCAYRDEAWNDGPLAHILPNGHVVSYVPSGGPAELEIPTKAAGGLIGITWDEAVLLEGSAAARQLRCFVAEMAARLPDGAVQFSAATGDWLRTAVVLLVARKVRYEARLTVAIDAPPPAFRRFAQNAGIFLTDGGAARSGALDLAGFAAAVAPAEAAGLATELNRMSEVIPVGLTADLL